MANKYATLDEYGTKGFRSITEDLAKDGINITPARVRIILLTSLEKIIKHVAKAHGKPISRNKAKELVLHPEFQNRIAPIIDMVYHQSNSY